MAIYTYRCATDGPVDVRLQMGTAPATLGCPACGAPAPRQFSVPMLSLSHRGALAALDRAEASRSEPAVVPSLPVTPRRTTPRPDPRTARLPRP